MPGGSILSLLHKFGRFEESVIRCCTAQLLEGLGYLHGFGVMHRDIKAANVLVTDRGEIKLSDFGTCAAFRAPRGPAAPPLAGTVLWMAPEAARQDGPGLAADVWSVGCTLIEMASACAPWHERRFEAPEAALFHIAQCAAPPAVPLHLSPDAQDFIALCLQLRPGDRPGVPELQEHPLIAARSATVSRTTSGLSVYSLADACDLPRDFSQSAVEIGAHCSPDHPAPLNLRTFSAGRVAGAPPEPRSGGAPFAPLPHGRRRASASKPPATPPETPAPPPPEPPGPAEAAEGAPAGPGDRGFGGRRRASLSITVPPLRAEEGGRSPQTLAASLSLDLPQGEGAQLFAPAFTSSLDTSSEEQLHKHCEFLKQMTSLMDLYATLPTRPL